MPFSKPRNWDQFHTWDSSLILLVCFCFQLLLTFPLQFLLNFLALVHFDSSKGQAKDQCFSCQNVHQQWEALQSLECQRIYLGTSGTLGQLKMNLQGCSASSPSMVTLLSLRGFYFCGKLNQAEQQSQRKIPFPQVLNPFCSFSSSICTSWSWKKGRTEYFRETVEVEMLLNNPHKWWIPGDELSGGIPKNTPGTLNL